MAAHGVLGEALVPDFAAAMASGSARAWHVGSARDLA